MNNELQTALVHLAICVPLWLITGWLVSKWQLKSFKKDMNFYKERTLEEINYYWKYCDEYQIPTYYSSTLPKVKDGRSIGLWFDPSSMKSFHLKVIKSEWIEIERNIDCNIPEGK